MKSINELDLIALIKASQLGDKTSYHLFLTHISNLIGPRLLKKIYQKNDVEDVMQNILLSIHKNLATYDSALPFYPWLWTIVDRRIIDYIRKFTSDSKNLDNTIDVYVTNIASEANILTRDNGEIFNCLSPELQKAIKLTKVEGLSTTEAAKKLGINDNALRTRISRAMNIMKKNLENSINGDNNE